MKTRVKFCRACGGVLYEEAVLSYKNMPRSAQYLPSSANDKAVDINLRECSKCGLLQLDCKPVPYYREVIRASALSKAMGEFRKKQFSAFVKEFNLKDKKFIECGCGSGEYLSIMREAGLKVYGTEYSKAAAEACKKQGLKVSRIFPCKNLKLPHAPFQAFGLFNSFEHFPNPSDFLQTISNNLSENAVGLIEVPNFEGSIRENVFFTFIADHLFYFTRQTLRCIIEMNGFDVIKINTVWHKNILSATVKRRKKIKLSGFIKAENEFRQKINNFISLSPLGETAFWGAGHEALFLLASAKLGRKEIKYIIDAAPFKQGKFSPATHIPIVSPEELNKRPPKAIIIAAGSYSEELAKFILNKYGKKIHIAIVRKNTLEVLA